MLRGDALEAEQLRAWKRQRERRAKGGPGRPCTLPNSPEQERIREMTRERVRRFKARHSTQN